MRKDNHKIKFTLDDVGDFLAKFTEFSDHVYWISSPDLKKIQYISSSYERIWGRSREELYLNPEIWITFLHPDDVVNHHPIHEMAEKIVLLGDKARYAENYRIIRPDGEIRWIMDNGFPVYNEQGICYGVSGIAIDITEQKKIEIELKIAKNAAEAANHAKTEFIANMSHDIRTPLTGVIGASKMLEDNAVDPNQKKYAHWVGNSGEHLLHMLNGILDIVSAENLHEHDLHEEVFDLHHMLQTIFELERPSTLINGIDFVTHIDETIPHFYISDYTKLHRILLNLVGNALKFTEKGRVAIDVTCLKESNSHALLQFRVSDTGIGIPAEMQDKVFDRFFRASPSYKGLYKGQGVGLHIAQSYACLLGCEIKLTSAPGVGTTFYFDLLLKKRDETPFIPPSPIEKPQSTVNAAAIPHHVSNVLLVEDNAIALLVLESIITQSGCQHISAMDGRSALELARHNTFDLIITDLGLPDLSGVELTKKIRGIETSLSQKPTPIIGLTAHAQDRIRDECLASGMNDVYGKPMDLDTLSVIKSKYLSPTSLSSINTISASALGPGLPNTEQQLFELDAFPVFDEQVALKQMGLDLGLLLNVLQDFIEQQIPSDIALIKEAHNQKNWDLVEQLAHKIKGGVLYCGTIKMKYACQYLERYRKAGYETQLERLYHQLIQVTDEARLAVINWLNKQGNK